MTLTIPEREPPPHKAKNPRSGGHFAKGRIENNNALIVTETPPDCNQFERAREQFILLGFTLGKSTRAEDGCVMWLVGHWTGCRTLGAWHGVVGTLASLGGRL